MKKIYIETPFGQETLHQPTLDAATECLAHKLSPLVSSFSALPAVNTLARRMLPAVNGEFGESDALRYLEVTPDCLSGFGFSIQLRSLPHIPSLSSPLECWGFGLALAETLRAGSDSTDGIRICPLYVENALNLAAENPRMTVGLERVASRKKSPRQVAECH